MGVSQLLTALAIHKGAGRGSTYLTGVYYCALQVTKLNPWERFNVYNVYYLRLVVC